MPRWMTALLVALGICGAAVLAWPTLAVWYFEWEHRAPPEVKARLQSEIVSAGHPCDSIDGAAEIQPETETLKALWHVDCDQDGEEWTYLVNAWHSRGALKFDVKMWTFPPGKGE